MQHSAVRDRGLATHLVLEVTGSGGRLDKVEFDDDGRSPPGLTIARAILASYPDSTLELILMDLLGAIVTSDSYHRSTEEIPSDFKKIDSIRAMLAKIGGHWQRNRVDYYRAQGQDVD